MSWRLPPLNALRAFEAAGRHISFTRAGKELHVTPGAVSRQIKFLEESLGISLFDRTNRELRLTEAGKQYLITLSELFERLDKTTKRLLDTQREQQLHIYCSMTFTLRWLVPRLTSFHALYPKRDIRLTTTVPTPLLLSTGDIDVALRQGVGPWPDAIAHRLIDTELLPVCSPRLLEANPLREIADLKRHTLLHSLARPADWAAWLSAAGATDIDPEHGIRFESSSLAYQAAIEGIGCVIGQIALVFDDLLSGRLVAPFPLILKDGGAFQLVYHENAAHNVRLVEFRDWMMAEAARFRRSVTEAKLPIGPAAANRLAS
jgi:LysR family transcriptional regulator, glycine cleavage system transcriptional activator